MCDIVSTQSGGVPRPGATAAPAAMYASGPAATAPWAQALTDRDAAVARLADAEDEAVQAAWEVTQLREENERLLRALAASGLAAARSVLPVVVCSVCGRSCHGNGMSKSQRRKGSTARCRECVRTDAAPAAAAAAAGGATEPASAVAAVPSKRALRRRRGRARRAAAKQAAELRSAKDRALQAAVALPCAVRALARREPGPAALPPASERSRLHVLRACVRGISDLAHASSASCVTRACGAIVARTKKATVDADKAAARQWRKAAATAATAPLMERAVPLLGPARGRRHRKFQTRRALARDLQYLAQLEAQHRLRDRRRRREWSGPRQAASDVRRARKRRREQARGECATGGGRLREPPEDERAGRARRRRRRCS